MQWTKLTRRTVLAGLGGAISLLPIGSAGALTTAEAERLVGALVQDINAAIARGGSEAQMIREFEKILATYGDMPIIAQTILGVPWRSASGAQRRAFTDALQGYLSRKYGKRFREFIGGTIEVQSTRQIRSFYEVKTLARLKGEAPFELIFLVSDGSGQDKFFNMIIEGINLRTTENTEITALLDRNRGNLDAMIQNLKTLG